MKPDRIVYLWPKGSPNNGDEAALFPRIKVYQPQPHAGERVPAVIVFPGGGYQTLAPHEAEPFAEIFAANGYVGIVCRYRVLPNKFPAPMADAARALRTVRKLAPELGVDPGRVAAIGFSAGGHLLASIATQPDLHVDPEDDLAGQFAARPDRVILAYGAINIPLREDRNPIEGLYEADHPVALERYLDNIGHVSGENPPAFLFHTQDDPVVPVENSLRYAMACREHGVPVETHIYAHGRHGVGLAADDEVLRSWPSLMLDWLRGW